MTSFATVEDLEAWTGLSIVNYGRAEDLLEAASEEIRGAVGQVLDAVADDQVTLTGSGGPVLFLPQTPVTDVSDVTVDGTSLEDGYTWEANGTLRRTSPDLWLRGSVIEVTYDHGYSDVPADIAAVCKDMAGRALVAAGLGQPDALQGQVAIAEAVGFGPTVVLLASERRVLDRYQVRSWD